MKTNLVPLIFSVLLSCGNAKNHDNIFNEELVIKELSNGFVNSYFQFTTRWNTKSPNDRK